MSEMTVSSRPIRRIAIIQSAYIPWRGFFDMIARCDEYVIFDSVQFAKRHWHNRNVIVAPNGPMWLTIPVATKSRFEQPIDQVEVSGSWAEKHWRSIASNYRRAPHFKEVSKWVEQLFHRAAAETFLTKINQLFLTEITARLKIQTEFSRDLRYLPTGSKTERLVDICKKANATHYLTGPSARSYLDECAFQEAGVSVEWMEYPSYPVYPQVWEGFEPAVTVLDLLFNAGVECQSLWNSALDLETPRVSSR